MRTLQLRIQKAARDTGVNQIVLERDYAQSYVLLGIASRPELRESLVFKGGTALRKDHLSVLCPEVARTETRAIVVPEGDPALPAGTYAFLEFYCGEPGCRCDNVMLNVCDGQGAHLATINHSLTPGGFADVEMEDSFLDPLNRQSRLSDALLDLV